MRECSKYDWIARTVDVCVDQTDTKAEDLDAEIWMWLNEQIECTASGYDWYAILRALRVESFKGLEEHNGMYTQTGEYIPITNVDSLGMCALRRMAKEDNIIGLVKNAIIKNK